MRPIQLLAKAITEPIKRLGRALLNTVVPSPEKRARIEKNQAIQAETNARYAQTQASNSENNAKRKEQQTEVEAALAQYDLAASQVNDFNAGVREQQARYAEAPVLERAPIGR